MKLIIRQKMLQERWTLRFNTATTSRRTSLLIFSFIDDGECTSHGFELLSHLLLGGMLDGQNIVENIDLVILRHNELDIPSLTSPLMYEKIAARKSVPQLYEEKIVVSCVSSPDELLSPLMYPTV